MVKKKEINNYNRYRVPTKFKEKFLVAMANEHMKSISDAEKIDYANRHMKHDFITYKNLYGNDCLRKEIAQYCPNLVSEWDRIVDTYGEEIK